MQLELEEFQRFRSSKEWFSISNNPVQAFAPTGGKRAPDLVADFKKGIKRDANMFPTLKQDKQWDNWQRAVIAQARAQDLSDVLDPTFVPLGIEGGKLFSEKQKFMYAVFERTLVSDKGKALVRQHLGDFNAQHLYKTLCAYSLQSTKASIDSRDLLQYITSNRLGDGKWKSSTHAYILHWQDQVRRYEDLVPKVDHFSPGQKRAMIENAVSQIDELRVVKTQAAHDQVRTGKALTYDEYASLLLSASQTYDAQFEISKGIRNKPSRNVYNHEFQTYDNEYNIDSDIHDLQALEIREFYNVAFQRGPKLNKDQWTRLPSDAQTTWDLLSPEAKHIILEHKNQRPPARKTNLHDLSIEDIDAMTAREIIEIQMHDARMGRDNSEIGEINNNDSSQNSTQQVSFTDKDNPAPESTSGSQLLAHVTKRTPLPPGDVTRLLSNTMNGLPTKQRDANEIQLNGKTYRQVNMARTLYIATAHRTTRRGALVDRGANGGIGGEDIRVISQTGRSVDVQGIDDHQIVDIPIITAGAVIKTQRGEAIIIMHQYAFTGKGKTIHSAAQMEHFKQKVHDRSKVVGGLQMIETFDGYKIPINIKSGLPYITMRPYTDAEWDSLPHIILTSDVDWDPCVIDNDLDNTNDWFEEQSDDITDNINPAFDEYGDFRHCTIINEHDVTKLIDDEYLDEHIINTEHIFYQADNREIIDRVIDYETYCPMFAWLPKLTIQKTFENTTEYGRIPMSTHLKKHYKSPFPAFNVHRRDESVATDTVFSDTPAIDCGYTSAQFFCGLESLVCDIYGMQSDKQFVNTLEDNIRRRGAPNRIVSDRAQVEISKRVQQILRAYVIGDWQSEANQQHQNPSERKYQTVKRMANTIMDRTGSPAHAWLLALTYICFILNFTASETLGWRTPMTHLTGSTSDRSIMMRFSWWEPVFFRADDSHWPSESPEIKARFVGFSEHVGHAMTFKILTDDTHKVLYRSNIRSALDPTAPNLRLASNDGENEPPQIIKSRGDENVQNQTQLMTIDTEDLFNNESIIGLDTVDTESLIGKTFLTDEDEDGNKFRARIVKAIDDQDYDLDSDPKHLKFLCSMNDDQFDDVLSYNEIVRHIEKDAEDSTVWKFKRITSHEGPLTQNHKNWKGSSWNVMVEWEDGSKTSEPLAIIAADDPVTCAIYARDNDLLTHVGWKRFKSIARRQKKMFRMANQAKLRSFRTAPKYQYGFQVPKDYKQAIEFDTRNGNTKWQDATAMEFAQLDEYDTFTDLGRGANAPLDFKKIRVHLIFAVKYDGRHKARCVADGHLTDIPIDSVYSGVVSLRGIRMLIFLAELNRQATWATDIGNAYLEAITSEKVYIIAGSEFGDKEGHTLIIYKALYGLRTSGLRWHDRFSDVLRDLGFEPCKAEPDIWMRRNDDVYEYVAVYVDDLAIAMKDPQRFVDVLTEKHKFKLKGTGSISFHLGCDFFRDDDGTLCMAPRKYIEKMVSNYEMIFGEKPKLNVNSPLEKGDHPEIDTSEILDSQGTQQYQSLIGSLQWAVSLGRLDIATATMTLSSFRAVPRRGHLDRAKRVCSYLSKMKHGVIRFRTGIPDYSDLETIEYDWAKSVYGDINESIPHNVPEALGKPIVLTHYVDANLMHCLLTGRSVTGILHVFNQCPIDWFSKKQATVETATYGSEFVAARTCVEQIIDIRMTLRYLGVPILGKSIVFGDNKSVVDSSVKVHAKLHKRHNALSFHRVREAIAAKIIAFFHIDGKRNPADILSKHWGYSAVWPFLQPLMFWKGDTARIGRVSDPNV
jgi:hypothetical protein